MYIIKFQNIKRIIKSSIIFNNNSIYKFSNKINRNMNNNNNNNNNDGPIMSLVRQRINDGLRIR